MTEGEPCDAIYIILKGSAVVEKETNSRQTRVSFGVLQKGNCFGEAGMLLQESRCATVKANEEVFAFKITEERLQNLKPETRAKFFRQLATDLSKKLVESSKKIVTF